MISLVNVSNGGVIGDVSTVIITVEANDHPHGIVEFARGDNNVTEMDGVISRGQVVVTRRW